MNNDN